MPRLDPEKGLLVYVDGSSSPKTKWGGWAYAIVDIDSHAEMASGAKEDTTNNRMELLAPIKALRYLHEEYGPCDVEIVSDSEYICKGYTEWLPNWKRSNFKNVKNTGLWQLLENWAESHVEVSWRWVRGHNGHIWNEKVDEMARLAREAAEVEKDD